MKDDENFQKSAETYSETVALVKNRDGFQFDSKSVPCRATAYLLKRVSGLFSNPGRVSFFTVNRTRFPYRFHHAIGAVSHPLWGHLWSGKATSL